MASDVDERSRRCRHRRRNTDTTEEKEEKEERRNRGTGRRERKRENKEIARYLEKDMRRLVAVVSCFGHEILGASSPRSSYNGVGTTIDDRRWIIIAPIDRFFYRKRSGGDQPLSIRFVYLTSFASILLGLDQLLPGLANMVAGLIHEVFNAVH